MGTPFTCTVELGMRIVRGPGSAPICLK